MNNQTFTLTFGESAENHVGMQRIGRIAREGFHLSDLSQMKDWFTRRGCICTLIDLTTAIPEGSYRGEAYVMVVRKGLDVLLSDYMPGRPYTSDDFFQEQDRLEKDTKVLDKGRVVDKIARYNLCFGDVSQEPSYEEGKGRIVAFKDVPLLSHVRTKLGEILGDKGRNLVAEGNYYYDISKCHIRYHGDSERKKVIGIRVGATFPLYFQWYIGWRPFGNRIDLQLSHGDIYIMSEKAVGTDWRKSSIPTLRHAACLERNLN